MAPSSQLSEFENTPPLNSLDPDDEDDEIEDDAGA